MRRPSTIEAEGYAVRIAGGVQTAMSVDTAGDAYRVAFGLERHAQTVDDRGLVVDNENGAALLHAPAPAEGVPRGSRMRTRVPLPSALCTVSSPTWRSTTERAIAMPSPVPSGLVVKKRSNRRVRVSSFIPGPSSSMAIVIDFRSAAHWVVMERRPCPPSASSA